ncbi:MAG: HAD-IC family P-type ATPase, partial [Planctomycetota bacterium]
GAAIVRAAEERGINVPSSGAFRALAGKGAAASLDGRAAMVGNRALLEEHGVRPGDLLKRADEEERAGRTVVFVVSGGLALGIISMADPLRTSAKEAVEALRGAGLRLVMLTGDAEQPAQRVADALGIDEVRSGVRPEGKQDAVTALKGAGSRVAMAGDGINDAPALAAADVGIAMGTGTDVAMETAAVTLVGGDLRALVRARALSRATVRNIRQNLAFAFGYNALCIPLAAGALYPLTGWLLSPMVASAAMSLSSVSVIANALRLRRSRLDYLPEETS